MPRMTNRVPILLFFWICLFLLDLGIPGATPAIHAQAISIGPTLGAAIGNRTPGYKGDGGPAADAELNEPIYIIFDSAGNLYISDSGNNVVRKVAAGTGIITTIAGNGAGGFSGDGGPAISAELSSPGGLVLDAAGNLYIADEGNQRIRKVAISTGIITTVAGNGTRGFSGDGGLATNAELNLPSAVALDAAGNLYIADLFNSRVRRVDVSTAIITTFAGSGTEGNTGDGGPATSATLSPINLKFDSAGDLYICNTSSGIIDDDSVRKVSASTGIISTVAGTGVAGYSGDGGPAINATLYAPVNITFDAAGNLYIADSFNEVVRKVDTSTGIISTVAGLHYISSNANVVYGFSTGTLNGSEVNPYGVAFDPAGKMYIADPVNNTIRAMGPSPSVLQFPTTSVYGTNHSASVLLTIVPVTVNTSGTVITDITTPISETGYREYTVGQLNCALNTPLPAGTVCDVPVTYSAGLPGFRAAPLIVTTTAGTYRFGMIALGTAPEVALTPGTISTAIGTGSAGFSGNGGPATAAAINNPTGLTFDSAGNLYFSDSANNQVREVLAGSENIVNVAGSSTNGSPALNAPSGVAVDPAGNVYISDGGNHIIRRVSANDGSITTIAGSGAAGYSGDGGLATAAELNQPSGLALDRDGNLYIADCAANVVREISVSTGNISTIAGDGSSGYSGDGGAAVHAALNQPCWIALDEYGNLFISDNGNNIIRQVVLSTGVISTVAGTGSQGFSGDNGKAINAQLSNPGEIQADPAGDIYFTDGETRIRKVDTSGVIQTVAGGGANGSLAEGGPATSAQLNPSGMAIDAEGNLYIANGNNTGSASANRIRKVDVANAQMNFASTAVGTTSADSPQIAVVSDIGNGVTDGSNLHQGYNEELQFFEPQTGSNPQFSNPDFNLDPSGTCPMLEQGTSPFQFNQPGQSCTYAVSFKPVTAGPINGTLTISDSALNTAPPTPATQVIHLNTGGGATSNPLADFTIAVTPASQMLSPGQTATFNVVVTGVDYFSGTVNLTTLNLPTGLIATLNLPSVSISGSTPATATLTVSLPTSQSRQQTPHLPWSGAGLALCGMLLPGWGLLRKKDRIGAATRRVLMLAAVLAFGFGCMHLTGCANIGLEGNVQTYTFSVQGTSGSHQHAAGVSITQNGYTPVKYH